MSNNKRRSTRSTSSHHSFSHSRKYLNPPNDNVQRRVSVVSSSSSRHYIRTNDIVILVQQPSTTSEIVSECAVCMVEKSVDKFKGIYEKSCVHVERTVCNSCVYEHIKVLLENSMFDLEDIACPEPNCPGRFSYQTIQLILVVIGENTELFKRYDQHLTNLHLSRMPGFVWCAYGCGSGHLHYFLPKLDPVVICMKCDQRTCFNHRVIWHTNMACDQYDLSQIQSAESDANHKWLELFAKQCPKCQWHIEKNEGCDHMTCRYCEHEFCWQCLADYEPIAAYGNSEHDTSCIYYETY